MIKIHFIYKYIELLKNSIVQFNKTISIVRFHEIETDVELIFQKLKRN